jgi:membrane protease YdiL (CAAX protease family)
MSDVLVRRGVQRDEASGLGPAAIVGVGCVLLATRTRLDAFALGFRLALIATIFACILGASLLAGRSRLRASASRRLSLGLPWSAVLAVGLIGVALAAMAAGTSVPLPVGVATLPLSILAAVAEEALFRRTAFEALERFGAIAAVVGAAVVFAAVHLPLYGVAAFPVDLGAGLLFGWQRAASGTWTAPAATHAAANLLAVLR